MEISPEYINGVKNQEELNEIKKLIRLEKGVLSSYENIVKQAERRLKSNCKDFTSMKQ